MLEQANVCEIFQCASSNQRPG